MICKVFFQKKIERKRVGIPLPKMTHVLAHVFKQYLIWANCATLNKYIIYVLEIF